MNTSRAVLEIGYFVREYVPCLEESFDDLPPHHVQIIFDHLSVFYDFDQNHAELREWIKIKAAKAYTRWRHACRTHWKEGWEENPPEQIQNRLPLWRALCASFGTEKQLQKSSDMVEARKMLTVFHKSGTRTFIDHAAAHRAKGSVTPHIAAYIDVYGENKNTDKLKNKMKDIEATISSQQAEADCGTRSMASVPKSVAFETEVKILEEVLGSKRGTVIRGVSTLPMREPRPKHKASGSLRDKSPTKDQLVVQQRLDKMEQMLKMIVETINYNPSFNWSSTSQPVEEEDEEDEEEEEDEEQYDGEES